MSACMLNVPINKNLCVCVSLRERKLVDCLDVAVWLIVLRQLWLQSKKPFPDTRPSQDKSVCSINHVFSFKAFTRRMRFIVQIIHAKKNRTVFSRRISISFWEATIFGGDDVNSISSNGWQDHYLCLSAPSVRQSPSVGLVRVVAALLSHTRPWHLQLSLELTNRHPKIHLEPTLQQFQLLSYFVGGGAPRTLGLSCQNFFIFNN